MKKINFECKFFFALEKKWILKKSSFDKILKIILDVLFFTKYYKLFKQLKFS